MIGTVTRGSDLARVDPAVVPHAVALDVGDPAKALRAVAPKGRGPRHLGGIVR